MLLFFNTVAILAQGIRKTQIQEMTSISGEEVFADQICVYHLFKACIFGYNCKKNHSPLNPAVQIEMMKNQPSGILSSIAQAKETLEIRIHEAEKAAKFGLEKELYLELLNSKGIGKGYHNLVTKRSNKAKGKGCKNLRY